MQLIHTIVSYCCHCRNAKLVLGKMLKLPTVSARIAECKVIFFFPNSSVERILRMRAIEASAISKGKK